MSDAPLSTCSECGGRLQKLLYPVGVQFKGSGFYSTDYKNGSRPGNGSSSSESKSEGTSESKAGKTSDGASGTKTDSKATTTGSTSSGDPKAG
jgi:hypothetical protein